MKRKTLEDYHKKYPKRVGDSVERFYAYEDFCKNNPRPFGYEYHAWYARLKAHMESLGFYR